MKVQRECILTVFLLGLLILWIWGFFTGDLLWLLVAVSWWFSFRWIVSHLDKKER